MTKINYMPFWLGITSILLLSYLLLFLPPAPPPAAGFDLSPVTLPINWRDFPQLVALGVIDEAEFRALYAARGGLPADITNLLVGTQAADTPLVMTPANAGALLNLFWAFGLANQNSILTAGPMTDSRYGGDPGRFASTGGWTLSQGDPMDHYSAHSLVVLTPAAERLVTEVSRNIFRPCCGNSTHFPDCNHGLALLGLLELMAAAGVSEADMYDVALKVNTLWFPDHYQVLATYFAKRGVNWLDVDSKTVLGPAYSSASGFQRILAEVNPPASGNGSACGV